MSRNKFNGAVLVSTQTMFHITVENSDPIKQRAKECAAKYAKKHSREEQTVFHHTIDVSPEHIAELELKIARVMAELNGDSSEGMEIKNGRIYQNIHHAPKHHHTNKKPYSLIILNGVKHEIPLSLEEVKNCKEHNIPVFWK